MLRLATRGVGENVEARRHTAHCPLVASALREFARPFFLLLQDDDQKGIADRSFSPRVVPAGSALKRFSPAARARHERRGPWSRGKRPFCFGKAKEARGGARCFFFRKGWGCEGEEEESKSKSKRADFLCLSTFLFRVFSQAIDFLFVPPFPPTPPCLPSLSALPFASALPRR